MEGGADRERHTRERPRLLAAIRHFGWGGLGKLRLILDELPQTDVALYGGGRITGITEDLLGPRHKFSKYPPQEASAALVINDSPAANKIAGLGVPVVYLDSLPYTRQSDAEIPALDRIDCYCAQKYPLELAPLVSTSLQKWPAIKWVDPIVPPPRARRGGRGIVITMGGLHTYDVGGIDTDVVERSVAAYLTLVLFPLVELLRASGRKVFAVCGNLSDDECRQLRTLLPGCEAIGPQTPYAFERILTEADLLIASPGNTTILHALSIDLPTLLLPPQNLSQVLHGRIYARPGARIMQWPVGMLDPAKVDQVRPQGLNAVLRYIHSSIVDGAASSRVRDDVRNVLRETIESAPPDGVLNQDLSRLGFAGASQVARLIEKAMVRRMP
jgi:hydroxymethylcytosylglucuronate/cytosylglucuronate synthase